MATLGLSGRVAWLLPALVAMGLHGAEKAYRDWRQAESELDFDSTMPDPAMIQPPVNMQRALLIGRESANLMNLISALPYVWRNLSQPAVFSFNGVARGAACKSYSEYEENAHMNMPKTIAGWCMILFFLLVGLGAFVPALSGGFFPMLTGLLALGVAVFTFLGK